MPRSCCFPSMPHARDVADADGIAIAIGHDDIGKLRRVVDLIVGVDRRGLLRAVEGAFGVFVLLLLSVVRKSSIFSHRRRARPD